MSSTSCSQCSGTPPTPYCHPKISCKSVKICVKTIDRASSPLKLISPCDLNVKYLPRKIFPKSNCQPNENSQLCLSDTEVGATCPNMQSGNGSPTSECNNCGCVQTCAVHGPNCPYERGNKITKRSWARADPDPLE